MMKKISDERLDKMLTVYCEADCEQTFTYDPEKKREKIVPFVHYRKQLIAAASLVLVSVLSLILYFSFGNINNTPLTVAPSQHKLITPSSTEGGGGGDPDRQDNTAPTESKSFLQRIHDFFFPDDAEDASNGTSPTEKGSASADNPSLRRNPSTIPSATQPSDPPIDDPPKATEAGDPTPITETPTEPDDPPYVPPTIPMDPPWYNPEPTDPPDEGDDPLPHARSARRSGNEADRGHDKQGNCRRTRDSGVRCPPAVQPGTESAESQVGGRREWITRTDSTS